MIAFGWFESLGLDSESEIGICILDPVVFRKHTPWGSLIYFDGSDLPNLLDTKPLSACFSSIPPNA